MGSATDYERCVQALDAGVEADLDRQVLDESRPDDGGYVDDDMGFATPSAGQTPAMATRFGFAALTPESEYYRDERILERFERAMAFQRRCQRESGCIDLPISNFDSPPDSAFGVAILAPLARHARNSDVDEAETVAEALEPYLRSAAGGIADGGFHTANHRWVIVSALAQVQELYPEKSLSDRVDEYLAEGIDINDDGEYTERSHGIYSHVVNEHLIDAALALDRPSLLDPVRESLDSLVDFMNHDWTVETSVSRRQDQGQRLRPLRGAPNFYYMARLDDDERYAAAAHGLLENGGWDDADVALKLFSHFARHEEFRESDLPAGWREESLSRQLRDSGTWRIRDGRFAATVTTNASEVVSLSYGSVDVDLHVVSTYFGTGFFDGTDVAFDRDRARVTMERRFRNPEKPCYWEPLGRPVDWGDLDLEERTVDSMPEFTVSLTVKRIEDGLDLNLQTEGGVPGVPFAIEARFPVNGWLEFPESAVPATEEGPVFLGDETVTYRRDGDAVSLGPGHAGHRLESAPDDPDGALRVLVTDWSPVDRSVAITAADWTGADTASRTAGGPGAGFDVDE